MNASPKTARPAQIAVVRSAAVLQGLALVTIPTLGSVLTDPGTFALSQAEYGGLFVPQTALAIGFSLAGGRLTRRIGIRSMLLTGFAANALSMGSLAATRLLQSNHERTYVVLLFAAACLGLGFAVVTPALNVLSARLNKENADRAVLVTNALLGAAAAFAPLLLVAFVRLGIWWALPLTVGVAMLALIAASARLPFETASGQRGHRKALPGRFLVFAAFALVYGLCEQMAGSWAVIYLGHHFAAKAAFGSFALAVFWAAAAGARVAFALASKTLAPTLVFRLLPFVLAASFVALAATPARSSPLLGVLAFAFAGLGVSALLPLAISFCERSIPDDAASATSVLFATYLTGYGLAAFIPGPLQRLGITLTTLYGFAAAFALIVAALAFQIIHVLGKNAGARKTTGDHA